MPEYTQSQTKFINEFTRTLLVHWADVCLQAGELPAAEFGLDSPNPYVQHAFKKGWITKRLPRKVTVGGYSTAAAFLKR